MELINGRCCINFWGIMKWLLFFQSRSCLYPFKKRAAGLANIKIDGFFLLLLCKKEFSSNKCLNFAKKKIIKIFWFLEDHVQVKYALVLWIVKWFTLHKKEVFGQLNPLEKCFKIWYVYGKRKPTWFFSFFISSNFHFSIINALVYVDID